MTSGTKNENEDHPQMDSQCEPIDSRTASPAPADSTSGPHTPGPWFVGAQNDALCVIDKPPNPSNDYPRHDANVAAIAKVYNGNAADANARLIAAAPDLLAALKRLRDLPVDCSQESDREAWGQAHSAIAKAEPQ